MQFANPIWLWALAGLSIPVGIHLLSRKEGKVIRIGSLRHLQETNTQQFKGIRLNEIILLLLRCALIILFVLLISGLSFNSSKKTKTNWVLVEEGLESKPEIKSQLDIFKKQGYELHWLTTEFPLVDDSSSVSSSLQYWNIVEQLKSQNFSDAIVFSKSKINGFKGMRPPLPSNIRWISVPLEPKDYTLNAIVINDSIVVRTGHTNSDITHFTTQTFPVSDWNELRILPDTLKVVLVSDDLHLYDKKIVLAALNVIGQSFPIHLEVSHATPEKFKPYDYQDWCIWLANRPLSDSVLVNTLYLNPDLEENLLLQKKVNRWAITKRLNEEIALNDNLTIQLASLLIQSEKDWDLAVQNDSRILSDSIAWSDLNSGDGVLASVPAQSPYSYLIALLLITLLMERMLAYHRNQ